MALQPDADAKIDRTATTPFLLRLFWRESRQLDSYEFSVAPPSNPSGISDYSSLLPASIRSQSVQIYTWPTCTLAELTGLLTSVLPANVLPSPAVGTRLVYKLIFPDTRASTSASGKGKWIDKPLGSVVVGGRPDANEDEGISIDDLGGDAYKTLAEARFVIGDYIACSIYPPGSDGRAVPPPSMRPPRDSRDGPRGPRDNGYPRSGGGGYRGGYGVRNVGGYGAPDPGDWRRGERPPPSGGGPYRSGRGDHGGRYGGRPY